MCVCVCVCLPTGKCWPWRDHVLTMLPAHCRQTYTHCHQVQEPKGHGHHWILRCVVTAAVTLNEWSYCGYPIVERVGWNEQTSDSSLPNAAFCLYQRILICSTSVIKTMSANSFGRSVYFNAPPSHFPIKQFLHNTDTTCKMWHLSHIKCQASSVIQSECGNFPPFFNDIFNFFFIVIHNFNLLSFQGFS